MSHYPIRIQRKRTKGWRMPPNTIYVGRPSLFGNLYRVTPNDYGGYDVNSAITPWPFIIENSPTSRVFSERIDAIKYSVNLYRSEVEPRRDFICQHLHGHDLACWCPLDHPCHADVLLELANEQ